MVLSITPLSDHVGAEVTGIDLSEPVTEADRIAMEQAMTDDLLLVVRDQALAPAQLLAALRLFGETMEQHLSDMLMEDHPEIAVLDSRTSPKDNEGNAHPLGSRDWHTDHTNHAPTTEDDSALCRPAPAIRRRRHRFCQHARRL